MVVVDPPPPQRRPDPIYHVFPAGTKLIRLFDPSRHGATATGFRSYGPLLRFDHHRWREDETRGEDPARGIYYAATTLSGCMVEIFGDAGVVDLHRHHLASPILRRELYLLDLRGNGAMKAGTKAAVSKIPDRGLSQSWSQYFYEDTQIYGELDGLIYYNAHNDEDSLALYERASEALECPPERTMRLDADILRPAVLEAADDNDLLVDEA